MASLEWVANGKTFELYAAQTFQLTQNPLPQLMIALGKFEIGADFVSFKVEVDDPVNGHPMYKYRFTHRDGRKWRQVIIMDDPNDPGMTFSNAGDPWRLSEFMAHREVRDLVIGLIRTHGLTKLEVTRV